MPVKTATATIPHDVQANSPGPWSGYEETEGVYTIVSREHTKVEHEVAVVHGPNDDEAEWIANIRLIRKAPDLLQCLQNLLWMQVKTSSAIHNEFIRAARVAVDEALHGEY